MPRQLDELEGGCQTIGWLNPYSVGDAVKRNSPYPTLEE